MRATIEEAPRVRRLPRWARAVLCVAFVIVTLLGSCFALHQGAALAHLAGFDSPTSQAFSELQSGSTLQEALRRAGIMKIGVEDAPSWLVEEVCPACLLEEVYATSDFSCIEVIGTEKPDPSSELLSYLESVGWTKCDSGSSDIATYVKGAGECRWILFQRAPIDGEIGVVLHIRCA